MGGTTTGEGGGGGEDGGGADVARGGDVAARLFDARVVQLADSAFPAGSFAHSFGLEALRQLGHVRGEAALALRLEELVWHTAWSALPFLHVAYDGLRRGGACGVALAADHACDVFLSNHVANRASRAQGRAFLLAAEAMFDGDASAPGASARALGDALPFGHLPPVMGAVLAAAGVGRQEARWLCLYGAARSALSAAVRLGVVGPLRAQHLQLGVHAVVARALDETAALGLDDACSTAPLLEAAQGAHDRLYSRLFQS